MNKTEHQLTAERKLIETANLILRDEINPITGVRQICDLRYKTSEPNSEAFMPIRAIESETDHFVVGKDVELSENMRLTHVKIFATLVTI